MRNVIRVRAFSVSATGVFIMPIAQKSDDAPALNIAEDKVAFIIVKAREFDEKVADSDPDEGSNPTTTAMPTSSKTKRATARARTGRRHR